MKTESRLDFYGDQEERMSEFSQLSYPEFKQRLLDIHGSLPDIEDPGCFVDTDNVLASAWGVKYLSCREDKDMLMRYGFAQAQAQDNIQDAAVVINIAITFAHPFLDGNGRTSRAMYGLMSRGLRADDDSGLLEQLSTPGVRDLIQFSNLKAHWIEHQVYLDSEVSPIATSAWYLSGDETAAQNHYGEREYHGLEPEEQQILDQLIGEKYGSDNNDPGRYSSNFSAVRYGLSAVSHYFGIELPVKDDTVNIPDSLEMLNGDQKRALITYIQQYQTLYAKGAIDLYAQSKNEKTETRDGTSTTVGSVILGDTINYLTSRLK